MLLGRLCPLLGALLAIVAPVFGEEDRTHGSVSLRTHSLTTPFLDSDLQSRWFDYGGDTIIRADRYVRLASDHPSQNGWIFSRVPLTATNWEIEMEFSIHGKNNLFGDGMGMFLTRQRAQQGTVFGFQDRFEGLGIFIDTYKNNRPGVIFPYVMAMLGDGNTPYDKDNDGKANELAGCSARGLRNTDFPTKMKVTYFAEQSLKVELMYKKEDEWTQCFEVPNVKLPSVTYLGLTAETGELSDNFDIMKLETKNLYSTGTGNLPHGKNTDFGKNPTSHAAKSGGSWTWFFLKFIIFGLLLTGAYVGFTMYRAGRRDRF
ncbi:legume-like lectin family protein [Elsinoe australis]|uniref:Legume-like lectin family protein n=1 Tax=Elsinoe australis TaxID=40998 RepID=A0A4U7BE12_9PEZI|nr:legume-like lectin family protein [Elsinoe australis]